MCRVRRNLIITKVVFLFYLEDIDQVLKRISFGNFMQPGSLQ